MSHHYLQPLFAPRAIAVFGAIDPPDAVGARVLGNLVDGGFQGPIQAIDTALGGPEALTGVVDLAILATPAATMPDLVRACAERGIKAALAMPDGFDASGDAGRTLERSLADAAERCGIAVLGPGSPGFMRPALGLNATCGDGAARRGSLALVSQSGALAAAVLDWADARRIGFSLVVSTGAAAGVEFGDILDYLALDPETRGILLYLEGLRDARRFMSGLRAAARLKPVVAIKAGRHAEGSRAAQSHTGALVGEDDVFDAALRRAGVVRARTIAELFAAAQLLAARHRTRGDRLAIVTNAGGPAVMATDRAVERGIRLAEPGEATLAALEAALPPRRAAREPGGPPR